MKDLILYDSIYMQCQERQIIKMENSGYLGQGELSRIRND